MDDLFQDGLDVGFGLTRGDRWFVAGIAVAVMLFSAVILWRASKWSLRPFTVDRPAERRYEYQVEINSGTWVEWMQLDGVGETLARRIVADREQNGPFRSIDELRRVRGVGAATLSEMRGSLRCSDCDPPVAAGAAQAAASPAAGDSADESEEPTP